MKGAYLAVVVLIAISAKQSLAHRVEEDCECTKLKPHVYVQQQPPIVVDRKEQNFVVKAPAPIVVRPAPVIIRRPGQVEVRPLVVKHQPKPVVVTKKIIKVARPILKKYYVEKYSKTEDCPCNDKIEEVDAPVKSCGCSQPCGCNKYY